MKSYSTKSSTVCKEDRHEDCAKMSCECECHRKENPRGFHPHKGEKYI